MRGFYPAIWDLLAQLPLYVIWAVGIVVALVRWQRHPRVSLLTLVGLLIALAAALLSTLVTPWLQQVLIRQGLGMRTLGLVMFARGLVSSLLVGLAWIPVLMAVFSGRDEAA